MFRKPRWSVTWPTRPNGVYTQLVRADDPTDAVRVAAGLEWPTADGYTVAFDYGPQVWRLLRPYRLRSHHVAGPTYPDMVPDKVGFTPEPIDLDEVAEQVVSAIRVCDALGHSKDEVRSAVAQIIGWMTPANVEAVLVRVAADTREINAFSRGEAEV
jgi:hypothetical protein